MPKHGVLVAGIGALNALRILYAKEHRHPLTNNLHSIRRQHAQNLVRLINDEYISLFVNAFNHHNSIIRNLICNYKVMSRIENAIRGVCRRDAVIDSKTPFECGPSIMW